MNDALKLLVKAAVFCGQEIDREVNLPFQTHLWMKHPYDLRLAHLAPQADFQRMRGNDNVDYEACNAIRDIYDVLMAYESTKSTQIYEGPMGAIVQAIKEKSNELTIQTRAITAMIHTGQVFGCSANDMKHRFVRTLTDKELANTDPFWIEYCTVEVFRRA